MNAKNEATLRSFLYALAQAGWKPTRLRDEEGEAYPTPNADSVVSLTSEFEIVWITFRLVNSAVNHVVMVIPQNGDDMVSDWSFSDTDNFNETIERHLGI